MQWVIAMFFILPIVRSIAEVSEHDYDRHDTVIGTTYNNIGFWDHILFHPAGDAWHLVHHQHPMVPWWKQGSAHRYLYENDEIYRSGMHRKALLDQNIQFSQFPIEKYP